MPQPPSIPSVPRLVSLLRSFQFVKNPIPPMNEAIEQYGDTYKLYMGGLVEGMVTRDPTIIQHVLQKNHRNYKKSKLATETVAKYIGHGLLTSEGDYWLRQRRLIQPGFHRAKLAALVNIMNQVIDQRLDEMSSFADSGQVIELEEQMMKLAFAIVANTLFTTSMSGEEMLKLSQNITTLQSFIVREVRQPYFNPWFKISGAIRKHLDIAKESSALILKVIKERQASGQQYDDLLNMLLSARYEDTGEGMTDQQLLEESLILFVAGHETTANALSWTLYLLSQNPAALEKLLSEIKNTIGDRNPRFEDLAKLNYTSKIIQESMRLYPPAWVTDRVAIEDDEINGTPIPKDTMIVVYIYGVHHSEKYWEAPEQFRPERFEKEATKKRPAFTYMPFGGGPRLCIGNNFAMMEMQLALVKMLQRFSFELVPNQKIEVQPLITLRPRYGVKMRMSKVQ